MISKKIPTHIYPLDIVVVIDEDEKAANKKYGEIIPDDCNGYTAVVAKKKGDLFYHFVLIYLEKKGEEPISHSLIAHEAYHCVEFIMDYIKEEPAHTESRAYLLDYIVDKVSKFCFS